MNGVKPLTQGVHHLALVTDDMRKTIDFYVDVLGMPLVHAMKVPAGLGTGTGNRGNPPYEEIRHYFFDMGGNGLVAFFEVPAGQSPRRGATTSAACNIVRLRWPSQNFGISKHGFKVIRWNTWVRSRSCQASSVSIFTTRTASDSNLRVSRRMARMSMLWDAFCRLKRRRWRN